jgi:hypothetical protein
LELLISLENSFFLLDLSSPSSIPELTDGSWGNSEEVSESADLGIEVVSALNVVLSGTEVDELVSLVIELLPVLDSKLELELELGLGLGSEIGVVEEELE